MSKALQTTIEDVAKISTRSLRVPPVRGGERNIPPCFFEYMEFVRCCQQTKVNSKTSCIVPFKHLISCLYKMA